MATFSGNLYWDTFTAVAPHAVLIAVYSVALWCLGRYAVREVTGWLRPHTVAE